MSTTSEKIDKKRLFKLTKTKGYKEAFEMMGYSLDEGFLRMYVGYPFLQKELIEDYVFSMYPLEDVDNLVIGNYSQRLEVYKSVKNLSPIWIHGRPGIGKTHFVKQFCRVEGYHLFEINCSVFRTEQKLNDKVGMAYKGKAIGANILLFFDECDGLTSSGAKYLLKIFGKSTNPIILASNELPYISAEARKKCKVIEFSKPERNHLIALLCLYDELYYEDDEGENYNQKLRLNPSQIAHIAEISPDVRTAKNMLIGGANYNETKKIEIQEAVVALLRETDRQAALKVVEEYLKTDEYPFHVLLVWVAENLYSAFRTEPKKFLYNFELIGNVSSKIYKMDTEILVKALVFGLKTSERAMAIRFPQLYTKKQKIIKKREDTKKDVEVGRPIKPTKPKNKKIKRRK